MNEIQDQTQEVERELQVLQLALAAQEGERARLLAKYDGRISELKKAIKALERELGKKSEPAPEKPAKKKDKRPDKPKKEG